MYPRTWKGFTLIELLIVLVILMLGGKLVYEIFF